MEKANSYHQSMAGVAQAMKNRDAAYQLAGIVEAIVKWTHILISNAKSFIVGAFHRFGKKHFDRLSTACFNSLALGFAALTQ